MMENKKTIQQKDIEWVVEHDENLKQYRNSTVFITGATGLVGSELVRIFLEGNRKQDYNIHVVALVRDVNKAETVFGAFVNNRNLELCVGDVRDPIQYTEDVAYIFHTACITASKMMVEHPVDTIDISYNGTKNILEFAKEKEVRKVVYISSMEVYGQLNTEIEVTEEELGKINLKDIRSSYPEGKRICECLCTAYAGQYRVPVTIARLAQTFGPGVLAEDNRVYAQMAKSVIWGTDIVLHSDGTSEGNYCDIRDVMQALLLLGVSGEPGEPYNVANEVSHMQIAEMAQMVVNEVAGGKIKVIFDIPESAATYGYAPKTRMKLSSEKLRKLGWKPYFALRETYQRLIEDLVAKLQK